ncbi:MAG: C4-type zinc ribbon domain-containing protein [Actinomycetes bacterium]
MDPLAPLLVVQDRDRELDRLRHRHATLPERAVVAAGEADLLALAAEAAAVHEPLADLARTQQRLEDEAQGLADQAEAAHTKLYSGQVTAVKELQALQADVDMLRRHQGEVEERALVVMEEREPLDAALADVTGRQAARTTALDAARTALAVSVAEVEAEIAAEEATRAVAAAEVDPAHLALYERCRSASSHRVGVARLVGLTCQGCHLTIPAIEADALRRSEPGTVAHCDNCGAILVP